MFDCGIEETDDMLLYVRSKLVVISCVVGIAALLDGVMIEFDDW